MATPTLRPLGIGEILDAAIKLYTRHFRVFAICVLIFALPLEIIDVAIRASIDPDALRLGADASSTTDTNDAVTGAGAIVGLLQGLTLALATLACYTAVSDAWLGRRPEVEASLRIGLRRLLPSIVLSIVLTITLLLALVALVLPAVWLAVAFSLSGPILVLERAGPFRALGRSFELVSGRWWATFATFLVTALLVIVLLIILGIVLGLIVGLVVGDSVAAGAVANVVIDTIANVLLIPVFAAVAVIVYYDRRVRKEGLDMQLQAEAGESAAAAGGWEPPRAGEPSPAWAPHGRPPEPGAGERGDWQPPEPPRGPSGL